MPIFDILQARLVAHNNEQVSYNILHYQVSAIVAPEPTMQEKATAAEALWGPLLKAVMGNNADWRGLGLKTINPLPGTQEFVSTANAGNGAIASELLPRQCCGLISKNTGLPGRRYRGRMYVPFPTENTNDAQGHPTGAYLILLSGLATQLATPIVVAGGGGGSCVLTPILLHKTGVPGYSLIIGALERPAWATQRRRGSYGRPNVLPF